MFTHVSIDTAFSCVGRVSHDQCYGSFGVTIATGRRRTHTFDPGLGSFGAWWATIVPVIVLSLTVIAFGLCGDSSVKSPIH